MNSQCFLLRCGDGKFDVDLFLPGHTGLVVIIGGGSRRWGSRDVPWPESLTVEM